MKLFDTLKDWTRKVLDVAMKFLADPFGSIFGSRSESATDRTRSILAKFVSQCFQDSHDPDGKVWAPLKHRSGKPLIHSGFMMFAAIDAAQQATVDQKRILVTMDEPAYSIFHQLGTRTIPARKFMGLGDEGKTEVAEVVGDGVVDFFMRNVKVD